jgi:hypothetical protein
MKLLTGNWLNFKQFMLTLSIDTLFMGIAIFLVIGLSILIACKKDRHSWQKNAPALITTLGIFCTFMGVTIGLMRFNPDNSDSLRFLLNGLKLAFIPSALAIFISICFKLVYTHNYAKDLGGTFISKIEENTAAVNKLVTAVSAVEWQIAYKHSLEANIDANAELLATLESSLTQLIENVQNKPKELIESSKGFEQAILDTSSMLTQTGQELKNTLIGLGMNIKKTISTMEQQVKNTTNPIGKVSAEFNNVDQILQQLRPLNRELSDELKAALANHIRNLESHLSNELKKAITQLQQ